MDKYIYIYIYIDECHPNGKANGWIIGDNASILCQYSLTWLMIIIMMTGEVKTSNSY
jgi:hypothetical protein